MDTIRLFPKKCRESIRVLKQEIGVDEDTAYRMILMTATLMDLFPWDERVAEMILRDCGIELDGTA